MRASDVVIATITLARSADEERALLHSLEKLSSLGLPLIIADGGSGKGFVKKLPDFSSYVIAPDEKGLVQQVRASLASALRHFPKKPAILYTEPDKYPFFEGPLSEFVSRVRVSPRFGIAVAARNAKSFRTFPEGQQRAEAFMNEAFSWITRQKSDYCYGPLLLTRRTAELALGSPNHLGFGWRFWTMRCAAEVGLHLTIVELDLSCPKEQRGEDSLKDRLYRLRQLKQNIEGISASDCPVV